MAEDPEVHAVFVHQAFEGCLAGGAAAAAGRVPGSVACDDDPGGDGAVNTGEVGGQEIELLVSGAEGSAVEAGGAVRAVGGVGEVGFGVDHDDVGHAVFEGVPEGWVGEGLGLQGEGLRGYAG